MNRKSIKYSVGLLVALASSMASVSAMHMMQQIRQQINQMMPRLADPAQLQTMQASTPAPADQQSITVPQVNIDFATYMTKGALDLGAMPPWTGSEVRLPKKNQGVLSFVTGQNSSSIWVNMPRYEAPWNYGNNTYTFVFYCATNNPNKAGGNLCLYKGNPDRVAPAAIVPIPSSVPGGHRWIKIHFGSDSNTGQQGIAVTINGVIVLSYYDAGIVDSAPQDCYFGGGETPVSVWDIRTADISRYQMAFIPANIPQATALMGKNSNGLIASMVPLGPIPAGYQPVRLDSQENFQADLPKDGEFIIQVGSHYVVAGTRGDFNSPVLTSDVSQATKFKSFDAGVFVDNLVEVQAYMGPLDSFGIQPRDGGIWSDGNHKIVWSNGMDWRIRGAGNRKFRFKANGKVFTWPADDGTPFYISANWAPSTNEAEGINACMLLTPAQVAANQIVAGKMAADKAAADKAMVDKAAIQQGIVDLVLARGGSFIKAGGAPQTRPEWVLPEAGMGILRFKAMADSDINVKVASMQGDAGYAFNFFGNKGAKSSLVSVKSSAVLTTVDKPIPAPGKEIEFMLTFDRVSKKMTVLVNGEKLMEFTDPKYVASVRQVTLSGGNDSPVGFIDVTFASLGAQNNIPKEYELEGRYSSRISVGMRDGKLEAWCIDEEQDGMLQRFKQESKDKNPWDGVEVKDAAGVVIADIQDVCMSSDGELYILNGAGKAYSYDWDKKNFTLMSPGAGNEGLSLEFIAAGAKGEVYGVDVDTFALYKYGSKGWFFDGEPVRAKYAAVAKDKTLAFISPEGKVFIKKEGKGKWIELSGPQARRVAVVDNDTMYAIDNAGQLMTLKGDEFVYVNDADGKPVGMVSEVAANANDMMMVTDAEQDIYSRGIPLISADAASLAHGVQADGKPVDKSVQAATGKGGKKVAKKAGKKGAKKAGKKAGKKKVVKKAKGKQPAAIVEEDDEDDDTDAEDVAVSTAKDKKSSKPKKKAAGKQPGAVVEDDEDSDDEDSDDDDDSDDAVVAKPGAVAVAAQPGQAAVAGQPAAAGTAPVAGQPAVAGAAPVVAADSKGRTKAVRSKAVRSRRINGRKAARNMGLSSAKMAFKRAHTAGRPTSGKSGTKGRVYKAPYSKALQKGMKKAKKAAKAKKKASSMAVKAMQPALPAAAPAASVVPAAVVPAVAPVSASVAGAPAVDASVAAAPSTSSVSIPVVPPAPLSSVVSAKEEAASVEPVKDSKPAADASAPAPGAASSGATTASALPAAGSTDAGATSPAPVAGK